MSNDTISVRFGVKGLISFLPNACVVRIKIKAKDYVGISNAVRNLKDVLTLAGQGALADKLFFEMAE